MTLMLSFLTAMCAIGITLVFAQLAPVLIGQDVYAPDFVYCTQPDIRTNSSYYTQCNYFRSDGCNITNFRCTLASTISNANQTQLITFTVMTYAAMWPGSNDGIVTINLRYTDGRPFELLGVLQLWRPAPNYGNAYQYANRVSEVSYVGNINQQTYTFYGLDVGPYVAVYWDDGGTREGLGNPEISQAINIPYVFRQKITLQVKAMPPDAYNTNYQRTNRNFISYQLLGPLSTRTVLDAACVDPTKNRCLFWEWRSDMGNIINAKTQLESVPSDAAANGFVDSMYKFKIFPIGCCSRRTRITARLVYGGAQPLFPTQYSDYWNQRQTYGYGTDLAAKTIALARNYIEETPAYCFIPNNCQYQVGYQNTLNANWGPNTTMVACVADTASKNTLTQTAQLDTYTVNTLRRNYCQCFHTNAECQRFVNIINGKDASIGNMFIAEAWRSGLGQDTNNFDKYEDYTAPYDAHYSANIQYGGFSYGRAFGFDPDFQAHTNTNGVLDARDYTCNPYYTWYAANINPYTGTSSVTNTNNRAYNGIGLFADIQLDIPTGKKEINLYFSTGSNTCNYNGNSNYCNFQQPLVNLDNNFQFIPYDVYVINDNAHHQVGPMYNTFSGCNCLSLTGDYAYNSVGPSTNEQQDSIFYVDPNNPPLPQAYWTSYYNWHSIDPFFKTWQPDSDFGNRASYPLLNRVMCCNVNSPPGQSVYPGAYLMYDVSIATPKFGVGPGQSPMTVYASTFWQANIQQVSRFMNYADALANGHLQPYIQYPAFGASPIYWVPMFPNVMGNSTNPNICYSYYQAAVNPCINYIDQGPTKIDIGYNNDLSLNNLITSPYYYIYTFNTGTLINSVGAQFVYTVANQPTVFGVYGLDVFPISFTTSISFNINSYILRYIGNYKQQTIEFVNIFPTYARFQVVPTIQIYGFSEIAYDPIYTYTIDLTFRVSCPLVDMDPTNDATVGRVGYCAQFWTILNQNQQPMVIEQISGPSTVSEPLPVSPALPFGITANQILGDVLQSAEITVRLKYSPANNGDTLYFYFFPKTEPEQPAGRYYCGRSDYAAYSGYMIANQTAVMPDQSRRILPMICSIRSVPPACEYNEPQMLLACFRGFPFDYAVCPMQDLPSYQTTGNPLDYGRCTNYWFDWNINGSKVQGMSTFAQTYDPDTSVTIYDQYSVIPNLTPPPPIEIAEFPNPLVRATSCDNNNATCFIPNDDTNATGFTIVNQIHYCATDGVSNLVILQPNLVFAYPFSFNDQVGAMYCNKTTAYISVLQQELQTKALFGIQYQCNVSSTGYYTYTIRYGKSIAALADGEFPCYERLISYAIILTSFQASPGTLFRVPGCTRADNCCYQLPINVFGNTGNSDQIVNLNTCNSGPSALAECLYEIVVDPVTDAAPNLCLGSTYTFTVRSPQALVQSRKQPSVGTYFQYPWRCQNTFKITLPTLGFSAIGAVVTNADCRYEGSSIQFSLTYTNPECINAISVNNPNPQCRYNLWMAIEPTQVPCNCYAETNARLNNPFLITGVNTATYNLQDIIDFPSILPNPAFPSIPDGIYTIYFWISTGTTPGSAYSPYGSFTALASGQPRNAIQSQVTVQFDSDNGLKIILQTITYPRCPAKFGDNLTLTSTAIAINIRDNAYNGPYNLTFYTPTNMLISNYIIGTKEACCSTCGSLTPSNPYCNNTCAACDITVQDKGLNHVFYLGTGVYADGQAGLGMYYITAMAKQTYCFASYFPYVVPLNTLNVQVSCKPPKCYGQDTGTVYSDVQGGTQIPLTEAELIQNADFTIATARYYYNWTGQIGPNNNLTLAYLNQTYLPYVYAGNYTLNASDYHGCWDTAACTVTPLFPQLQIALVGVTDANCSQQQGAITIAVVPGTGVPPFTLYKVGPNNHPVMTSQGYILQDTSVTPNEQFFYMVCDGSQCCSQMLNLSISAPAGVTVGLIIVEYPCSAVVNSGILTAVVNPPNGAYLYTWYFNGNVYLDSVTYGTIRGLYNGVYQVVVTNTFTNCNNFAQVVLTTAGNLVASYERQYDRQPGLIQGVISGGNGAPFRVTVSPQEVMDTLIIQVIPQDLFYSAFKISEVVLTQDFRINFFDAKGCATSSLTPGKLTPVTNPPIITPTATPPIPHVVTTSPSMWPVYAVSAFLAAFSALILMAVMFELRRSRN